MIFNVFTQDDHNLKTLEMDLEMLVDLWGTDNYFDRDKTYMDEHIAILKNNRDKKDLCSFKEGKELMKLIVKTKEKVKKNSSFSAV